ncbi:MAG TPA: Holliday junction resolvase RuvX [Thermotogota bacterium]|nr:Holliday junction resolvase RuvX [Thermotogota bacterium]HRW34103.1 Holliday junction resolvase RuvX [Thermotogota bacterium]
MKRLFMEVLSFDYGDKRIGYAVASKKMKLAFAKGFIINDQSLGLSIKELIYRYQPEEIVVGLPLRKDMTFTPATDKALQFSKFLFDLTELEVFLVDERYSTVYSQQALRYAGHSTKDSKGIIDSESAKSIAETFIHSPAWAFRFNLDILTEDAITSCFQKSDSQALYLMGGVNVFEFGKKYQGTFHIFELNPYIFSIQRQSERPLNISSYQFAFSVPDGYFLCKPCAHGSIG